MEKKRYNMYLHVFLQKWAKKQAVDLDISLSEFINGLILDKMNQSKDKK